MAWLRRRGGGFLFSSSEASAAGASYVWGWGNAQAKADPMARQDSFELLDPSQRAYWTAKDGRTSLKEKIAALKEPIESSVSVDVILVGFSGDG